MKRPLALAVANALEHEGCGESDAPGEARKKTVLEYASMKDIRNINPHLYLGEMAAQAMDGGVFQLRRESMSKGIETQLGEDGSVSLGLHIAVDHGVNLMALCRSIINEVSYKVS